MKRGILPAVALAWMALSVLPASANITINVDTMGPIDADNNAVVTVNNATIFGAGNGIVRNADGGPLTIKLNGSGNIDVGGNGVQANTSLSGLTIKGGSISGGGVGVNHFNVLNGNFFNSANVAGVSQNGIGINGVNGSFTNNGNVMGGQDGIIVYNTTTGDFINRGFVTAANNGVSSALINGSFTNTGHVQAQFGALNQYQGVEGHYTNQGDVTSDSGNGINVSGSGVGGNFRNTGTVQANNQGFTIGGVGGHFWNSGNVTADFGEGINVYSTGVGGNLVNTATIMAGNNGFTIAGVGGDLTNTGDVTAGNNAISIYNTGVAGNLTNSGDLISSNNGINSAGVGGHLSNTGDITADNNGLNIYGPGVSGNLFNSGNIITIIFDAMAIAGVGGNFTNSSSVIIGADRGIVIYDAVGGNVTIQNSQITGQNSYGIITTQDIGGDLKILNSIVVSDGQDAIMTSNIAGDVLFNTSTIAGFSNGVTFNGDIGGNVTIKAGSFVTGMNQYGISISGTVWGDIVNQGTVTGDMAGIFFDGGSLNGTLWNKGTISSANGNAVSLGVGDFSIQNLGGTFTSDDDTIAKTNDGATFIENKNGTFHSDNGDVFAFNGNSGPNTVVSNEGTFTSMGSDRVYNGANGTVDTIHDTNGTWSNGGGTQVIFTRGGADVIDFIFTNVLRGDGPGAEVIDLANGMDTYNVHGWANVDGVVNGGGSTDTIYLELWGLTGADVADIMSQTSLTENPDGTFNLDDATGDFTISDRLYSWTNFEDRTLKVVNLATLNGLTPNQQAIGAALNPAFTSPNTSDDMQTVLANIVAGGVGNLPSVLNQLSPQSGIQGYSNSAINNAVFLGNWISSQAEQSAVFSDGFESGSTSSWSSLRLNDSQFELIDPTQERMFQSTDRRLASLGVSSGLASDVPGVAFGGLDLAYDDKAMYDNKKMIEAPLSDPRRFGLWLAGQGILADVDQADGDVEDFDYDSYNVSVGMDYHVTREVVLGVLFNYGNTTADVDGLGSNFDADSYVGGLYAGYDSADTGWFVNGYVFGGATDLNQDRRIVIGAIDRTASSDSDGWQISTGVRTGYLFDLNQSGTWKAGPVVGLQYTHLENDGYTESGAGALNLTVNSWDTDSLRSAVGGRIEGRWQLTQDVALEPSLTAQWLHEFLNDSYGITSAFNDPAAGSFSVFTDEADRDFGLVGLNLNFLIGEEWSAFVGYNAQFSGDYFGNSITGGARFEF